MDKRQRRKFEMFLRLRDFYNARAADFPADSVGGQLFTALLSIVEQLVQLGTDKFSIVSDVAQAIDIKGDAKDLLYSLLQDMRDMAAAMAFEINGLESKFRIPRNRSVQNLILAGRAFAADAGEYKDAFISYGLAPDFIRQLTTATEALAAAASSSDEGTQERVGANAALVTLFKDAMLKVNRLDPIVRIKYRNDAANLAAWIYASHREREPRTPAPPPAVSV
jgi:hypothetical protein